jgi:death-on-curing protein
MKITRENILAIYTLLTEATGGSVGVREEGLLISALEAPYQTFDGVDLYPTLLEKAVRLGYGLVANHPFIDGNKRIGILVMLTYLELNGISIEFSDNEIIDMALGVASGKYKYEDLLKILNDKL